MKTIGILGSTGSIGTQALDLINNNDNFKISYLSAYSNVDLLIEQAKQFKPEAVCIGQELEVNKLKEGCYVYELEADSTIPSEYILLMHYFISRLWKPIQELSHG